MMKKALGEWPGGPKPSAVRLHGGHAGPVRPLSVAGPAAPPRGTIFRCSVDVRDDCDVKKVEIQVMPQGLSAVATAPPYEWDLTGINGAQTITVTATDGSGKTGQRDRRRDRAGVARGAGTGGGAGAGCNVASGAFGAAGLVPSLAMLVLFSRHNRRSRRRTGRVASRELACWPAATCRAERLQPEPEAALARR